MRRLRGRPRHDDILTPREWEVLDLLREGLTNEQIADRLGVSFDTAKFHVSEIITKLGVESRQEAAAWDGRPRGVPVPAAGPSVWQRVGLTSPVRVFAATAIATVAVGMLVLAGGLLLMNSREGEKPAGADVEVRTGDEALDVLIDAMLTADAPSLASRFLGVTAREGVVIGGPIGIYQPATVPTAEWTARLAASTRELYAVIRDPVEPYPWNQSPAPPEPRAAVYAGARDYDVLFVVEEASLSETAWRMSIEGDRIVDLLIDNVPANPLQPYPGGGTSFLIRVRELMPNPDDAARSFVVMPPAEKLPPPVRWGPPTQPGEPPPSGVANPPFAPDGRTGKPDLDSALDVLLTGDGAALARTFATVVGSQEACDPIPNQPGSCSSYDVRVPLEQWTLRLASSQRALWGVYTEQASDVQVMIAVDSGETYVEAWKFGFVGGRLSQLSISARQPDPNDPPPNLDGHPQGRFIARHDRVIRGMPNVGRDLDRFFVLPPEYTLPSRPQVHALTTRTGDSDVDAILSAISTLNVPDFVSRGVASIPVRSCYANPSTFDAEGLRGWAVGILPRIVGFHSIAHVPPGYPGGAEHMIALTVELNRYRWTASALLVKDGRIVGLVTSDSEGCPAESMYPPADFIVAPPPDGSTDLDKSRRSGDPIIDAVLDAAYAGDETAMSRLISFSEQPCGTFEYAPPCPDGVAPMTPVKVLSGIGCHGLYTLAEEAPRSLIQRISTSALYAILVSNASQPQAPSVPTEGGLRGVTMIEESGKAYYLSFNSEGVRSVNYRCGRSEPEWLIGGNPNFLLPPP